MTTFHLTMPPDMSESTEKYLFNMLLSTFKNHKKFLEEHQIFAPTLRNSRSMNRRRLSWPVKGWSTSGRPEFETHVRDWAVTLHVGAAVWPGLSRARSLLFTNTVVFCHNPPGTEISDPSQNNQLAMLLAYHRSSVTQWPWSALLPPPRMIIVTQTVPLPQRTMYIFISVRTCTNSKLWTDTSQYSLGQTFQGK